MTTRKYADTFLLTLENILIVPRKNIFLIKKLVLADVPSCLELPQWEALNWSCDTRTNDRPWQICMGRGDILLQTLRLTEQLGQEGQVGENVAMLANLSQKS